MAIYTKTGDRGETSLYSPQKTLRIPKDSLRISAIGAIDEANSYIGICVSFSKQESLTKKLENIQRNLFIIGSILAKTDLTLPSKSTKDLEKEIDQMENRLSVLSTFILPGGDTLAAHLHFARSLVRAAERCLVALNNSEALQPSILAYINRLSDYLFILGRQVNADSGVKEKPWKLQRE